MTQTYPQRLKNLLNRLEGADLGDWKEQELLSSRTTWKVGGPADVWIEPSSSANLMETLRVLDDCEIPWVILGKGSNTLADDDGFRGAVVNLERGLKTLELERDCGSKGTHILTAGGGAPVAALLRFALKEKLAGIHMLTGVPGTVGGAVCMNAGTHLGEVVDSLKEVFVSRGGQPPEWVDVSALQLAYRHSNIGSRDVVVAARFQVADDVDGAVGRLMRDVKERRRETQPLTEPSGGSTFANPPGEKAWKLIADAGLKGKRVGGAWFSEMHANFLIQDGTAKADDVKALIELAKEKVRERSGVQLREEVSRLEPTGWRVYNEAKR